ncbi:MAG: bifunctional sulfate adenylyltransferase/adenylylsulfate kinase [Pyrinomonadaceae bacterium]|nr:bifunctional sulfate adenylyltransferase/adenylylsulfate kinase [Pyrinomonadaceae bacterium]
MTRSPKLNERQFLNSPYGGKLIDLRVYGNERQELIETSVKLPSIQLSMRSQCDLEMLATGAFSPLDSFMNQSDYLSVLNSMRLSDGIVFPIPITLPIGDEVQAEPGETVALRNSKFELLALMEIEEIYEWDLRNEAVSICGSEDTSHPLTAEMNSWGKRYISGPIKVVDLPRHHDFPELRLTPQETRHRLALMGNEKVVAFQTRNPMHRAHEELTKRSARETGGTLLIQPVVGMTKPGDVDHYTRVRCYKALVENYYDKDSTMISLIPLAMRMAGPRCALWHAIIRRNYGASHFIVGRDHASPGVSSTGNPFYSQYAAQELLQEMSEDIGVKLCASAELVFLPDEDRFEESKHVKQGQKVFFLSGTQVRNDYLERGKLLPEWFTRAEVAKILSNVYPARKDQGFCVWFTGLSGAGKSTIADVLIEKLAEYGRQITVLDGDVVRTHLSKGLGFSKTDRDTNIRRIGFVASEIVRHRGTVVAAAISPYQATRDEVRAMIGEDKFILVFVDTPIEVCESRDTKGLYAKARRKEITGFTGIDDPYQNPRDADLVVDTEVSSPSENAEKIIKLLADRGFIEHPAFLFVDSAAISAGAEAN